MSRSPSRLPSRLPRRRPAWLRLLFAQFIGILITTAGVLPGFLLPAASAQIVGSPSEPKPEPLRARLERLESLITPLQEEVLRLKLERSLPSPVTDEYFGHGPSMSKAFFSPTSLSWGATSEFLFQARQNGPDSAGITEVRFLLGYRLSSRLTFQSALAMTFDIPGHGPTNSHSREPFLDFALIDWRPQPRLSLRTGLIPTPIGERRLRPEPTLYADPLRSRVEEWIVPFDLSLPGVLLLTESESWNVQIGIVSSPDATRMQSGTFLEGAGARFQTSALQPSDQLAFVSRVEINWRDTEHEGLDIVLSALSGETGHSRSGISGARISVGETHVRFRQGRISWWALGALGQLSRAQDFESIYGTRPGSKAFGWTSTLYGELTPEPLPAAWIEAGIFASAEGIELENGAGPLAEPAVDRQTRAVRLGLLAKPVPNAVIKLAHQWRLESSSARPPGTSLDASGLDDDLWQFALGAVF